MADSPELQRIIHAMQSRPEPEGMTWAQRRARMETMQAALTLPDDVTTEPADADGVPVEWVRTAEASPDRLIFYLHGGGYTIGSIATHRFLMQALSRAAGATVLGVDYRLAPEDPFPAAVDDSIRAWGWLQGQDADPSSCVIAGDSAGGGLTLATLLRLRDGEGPIPAAAVCLSPWTDLAAAVGAQETKHGDPMVKSRELRKMAAAYLNEADPQDPLASPILADLSGLPPLLIQVGTAEHLLDDSTVFAERAEAAGVDVTLEKWEDMIHVFQFFPSLIESRQAIERIGEFVQRHTKA
jgi:acetyl esterase/lipase